MVSTLVSIRQRFTFALSRWVERNGGASLSAAAPPLAALVAVCGYRWAPVLPASSTAEAGFIFIAGALAAALLAQLSSKLPHFAVTAIASFGVFLVTFAALSLEKTVARLQGTADLPLFQTAAAVLALFGACAVAEVAVCDSARRVRAK